MYSALYEKRKTYFQSVIIEETTSPVSFNLFIKLLNMFVECKDVFSF
jgi:hypothetical protein